MATDGDGEPEATAAAPRLKRVRRRRKDAGSIATAGDEEADEVVAASSPIEQEPVLPAVAFDSPAATAVTVEEEEVSPQVVAPAAAQVPVSGGGTKGKKVGGCGCRFQGLCDILNVMVEDELLGSRI